MAGRILIIRGGAIGDFVLTLPAIRAIRDNLPENHIEILGYKHIIALAEKRFYADATRSIEYGPLARFFVFAGNLDKELQEYFAGFDQVISYLFDPDGIFETNLRRCDVKHLITADPQIRDHEYAPLQLARPLERLALFPEKIHPELFPSEEDLAEAGKILAGAGRGEELEGDDPWIALHPGSGSPHKNWPVERWVQVTSDLLANYPQARLLVVGGEADEQLLAEFKQQNRFPERTLIQSNLPLPTVAALLARARLFLGHDSGISHIAAAVGTRCLLLYGPTSAATWGPQSANTTFICSDTPSMNEITTDHVADAAEGLLQSLP
jgi:heptosyltransferase-2